MKPEVSVEDEDDYEGWLRATLEPGSAEIVDAQLGEFTLRTRRLEALPRWVADHGDLEAALRCVGARTKN